MALPGMTKCDGDACNIKPTIKMYDISGDRDIILITTAVITKDKVFTNGLYQNIAILYRMFDAMGLTPYFLLNKSPNSIDDLPKCIADYRYIVADEIVKKVLPIKYFLEIGMSIDAPAKKYMKMIGARLMKVYLGNILNIDIETSLFYPNIDFPHHIASGTDRVLVSPHYAQHAEYAVAVNGEKPQALADSIAPYVWDPMFLVEEGLPSWRPRRQDEKEVLIIMEPNISFQKTAIIPLLALERWYRKNKGWTGTLLIFNSDRLMTSEHFQNVHYRRMELFKDAKVELRQRQEIKSVLAEYPHATFLSHQVNNEFNYMFLELMWCGFPVIHNITTWSEFGYFYPGADLAAAGEALEFSRTHTKRIETYRAHAHTLAWRYSPYNPVVQEAWRGIITS